MKRNKEWNTHEGSPDPPKRVPARAVRRVVLAANDNSPGSRRITLRHFQSPPILLDEVAVVDRLLQELSSAPNDNWPVA